MSNLHEVVGQVVMGAEGDPPSRFGPITSPVDRFSHLPEATRKWLEDLREEDLDEIVEAVRFMRSARTIGRFGKWLVITTTALFIGAVALGENIGKFLKWFAGPK